MPEVSQLTFISKIAHAMGCLAVLVWVNECPAAVSQEMPHSAYGTAQLSDGSDGKNWPGPGRTFGEQHFSPLHEIDADSVSKLGLVWSMDLPLGRKVTLYFFVAGVYLTSSMYGLLPPITALPQSLDHHRRIEERFLASLEMTEFPSPYTSARLRPCSALVTALFISISARCSVA